MKRIFTSTNVCHFLTPQFKTTFDGHLCSKSGLFCNMRPFSAVCRFPPCMQTLLLTGGIQAQVGGGGVNLATIQRLPLLHPTPINHLHSHTHSPSPQSTHTCAWIWASLGCQSEPQEPQRCSAVWSNKTWGFLCSTQNTHAHAFTYTDILCIHVSELTQITDGDLILWAALKLPKHVTFSFKVVHFGHEKTLILFLFFLTVPFAFCYKPLKKSSSQRIITKAQVVDDVDQED